MKRRRYKPSGSGRAVGGRQGCGRRVIISHISRGGVGVSISRMPNKLGWGSGGGFVEGGWLVLACGWGGGGIHLVDLKILKCSFHAFQDILTPNAGFLKN